MSGILYLFLARPYGPLGGGFHILPCTCLYTSRTKVGWSHVLS